MKVLVTGASGFVGSHVAERLAQQGHELRLLLRGTSSLEFLGDVVFERADGEMRDADSLRRAVEGVDAVVHAAGLTSALTEADYQAVNDDGTTVLAQAAREAGVNRFVYVSSLAAQGPSPDGRPTPPETPRPITPYGRSKLAGELSVLFERERMSVAVIRPPAVYGPRDRALMPFYRLAKLGVLPLFGDGMNRLCTIHVHDCADAIVAALGVEGPSGSVYTIADGEAHTWRDLAEAFAAGLKHRPLMINTPPFLYAAAGYAGGLVATLSKRPLPLSPEEVLNMRERFWVCDSERIGVDLGWKPSLDLKAGMAQTLRWYRDNGWL